MMLEALEDRTLPSGDVLGTATFPIFDPVSLTALVQESIESVNDVDLFAVSLAVGDRLTVDVNARSLNLPGTLDSYLRVFDSGGNQVAFSDDDPFTQDALLTYEAPAADTYYVGISSFSNYLYDPTVAGSGAGGGSTGDYQLRFSLASDDTLAGAILLSLDPQSRAAVIRDNIESVNDADIFAVDLVAGERLTVDLDARVLDPVSALDSFLRVFDSNGIVVAFSNDDSSGSDASLTYQAIATGKYYLGISAAGNFVYDPNVADSGAGGNSTGIYDLKVSLDPGDTLAAATPVTVQRNDRLRVSNAIDLPTDVDLFAINLLAGDLVALNMPNFYGLDSVLRVFDSTGTQIALNDDFGDRGRLNSAIGDPDTSNFLQVAAAGTYYVGVSSFGNYTYDPQNLLNRSGLTTGIYDLDIQVFDADEGAFPTAPPVFLAPGVPVTVSGTIVADDDNTGSTREDLRFFAVDLLPGDRISAAVNTQGGGLNSLLRVFTSGGNLFDENDDANGTDSALEFQVQFGGRFFFVVSGSGSQIDFYGNDGIEATTTGSFDLTITLTPFADLRVTSLSIVEATARWGDQVTINYVLDNQGRANAGPFMVELRASADAVLDGTDPLLATIVVGGLAGRTSQAGSVMVQLPGAPLNPPAGFGSSAFVFVGSVIDRVDAVDESNESNNFYNPTYPTIGGYGLDLTSLVISSGSESEPNDLPTQANAAPLNGTVAGTIAPPRDDGDGDGVNELTDVDYFYVVLRGSGRLTARVTAAGVDTRLSLLSAFVPAPPEPGFPNLGAQSLLAQSDARALGDPDDLIVQHLAGGPTGEEPFGTIYLLRVEGLDLRSGAYTLTTEFQEAVEPFEPIPVGMDPRAVVSADFDRDGILDLAIANSGPNDLDDLTLLNDAFDLGGSISVLLGMGDGTFRPERRFLVSGIGPSALVVGHFNGDGLLDLAVASGGSNDRGVSFKPGGLSTLLGNGDGTFGAEQFVSIVEGPVALATGDFNRDGNLDLIGPTINHGVRFYRGAGDGTFTDEEAGDAGAANPHDIVAGDFDGDGLLDLATANVGNQTEQSSVTVSRGRGDGSFGDRFLLELIGDQPDFRAAPLALVTGDFNGDNQLDIATAARSFDAAILLVGNGDGTFFLHDYFAVGSKPHDLVAGDFNGDGRLDLAAANEQSQDVSILLGKGDGNFEARRQFAVGQQPDFLTAADFDRDGRLDVATANQTFSSVGNAVILLGLGDGTLHTPVSNPVGGAPRGFVSGDFNRDGRLDVATSNEDTADVSILLGQGDGTLAEQLRFRVSDGRLPTALATDDLNKDGRLDLAVVTVEADEFDHRTSNVLIYLGLGNGAFVLSETMSVGIEADDVVIGQFSDDNGDGRVDSNDNLDVAVVNGGDLFRTDPITNDPLPPILPSISILLGNGDGKLRNGVVMDLNGDWHTGPAIDPVLNLNLDLATGDFNRDGLADIAVALENPGGSALAVLLGNGDGTFRSAPPSPLNFLNLVALTVADFDGDHILDLAAAEGQGGSASVFRGRGDGTFEFFLGRAGAALRPLTGPNPVDIIATDLNDDEKPDLAIVSVGNGGLTVLLRGGDDFFTHTSAGDVLSDGVLLVSGDFNGDGLLDLATVKDATDTVAVLLTQLGAILPPQPGAILPPPRDVSFNPDLVTSSVQSTPLLADFNGDGTADSAVINLSGEVLLRLGDPENAGQFGTAVVLNPGRPARAVVPFRAGANIRLAAIDATPHEVTYRPYYDPLFQPVPPPITAFAYTISLYAVGPDGRPEFLGETLPVPETSAAAPYDNADFSLLLSMPSRIVTGNFNGQPEDGFDDLVVLMPLGNARVAVLLADGLGGFLRPRPSDLGGFGPVDLTAADLNADGVEDILVTNQIAGAVEVMIEDGSGFFVPPIPQYRTGTGLFGVENPNLLRVRTADETRRAALVDVNDDGLLDVIAAAPGAHNFSVLLGRGLGSFTNPRSIQVDLRPAVVVAGQFNDDNGDGLIDGRDFDDLAFLDDESERIAIFLGDGAGGFAEKLTPAPILAGNDPTGLSIIDVNGDDQPDLQIGNVNGDVLTLLGKGDGTFEPYQRSDRTVTLAKADLNGDGLDDFVFGNESFDRVAVEYSVAGQQTFVQDRADGILSPGAVELADLNGDGQLDLVVANGGANRVLVYLGTDNGQFEAAREFFVGTDPVGITVADITGDGILDVIAACRGSNDVYVLAGNIQGNAWTLDFRNRIEAGGSAPVSTTVVPDAAGGLPSLLITNSLSNDVRLVQSSSAEGTFNNTPTTIFPAGTLPTQALIGNFNGVGGLDLLVLNAGSNNMTFYSGLAGLGITLSSGGLSPIGGIVGDFNKDGADDLVVANNGDGKISLFFGGKGGLELVDTQEAEGLLHPSALRFCSLDGDGLKVYLTDEGEESITRLTFNLDFGDVAPTGLPGTPPDSDITDLAESRPFAEVTDALIAALLADAALAGNDETTEKSDTNADEEDKPSQQSAGSGIRGLIQTLFGADSQVLEDWSTEILDELGAVLDVTTDVVRNLLQRVFEALNISWNPFANGAAQPGNNQKESPVSAPSIDFEKPLEVHIPQEVPLSSAWLPRFDAELIAEESQEFEHGPHVSSGSKEELRYVVERRPISPRMADAFFRRFSMAALVVSALSTPPLVVLNSRKPNLREMGWASFSANGR